MQELGGINCNNCNYDQFKALIISYINQKDSKTKGLLNIVRYRNYLNNPQQAKSDLEVLCFNCQRRKMTKQRKSNNMTYQKYGKKYDIKQRMKVMNLLNQHNCVNCGENDFGVLEIAHKNGFGGRFIKIFKSKRKEWLYYFKNSDKIREDLLILCKNCNELKQSGKLQ